MKLQIQPQQALISLGCFAVMTLTAQESPTLPTLQVDAQQTANLQPVATYETPISNLEFEPRVDLQSRNMAEAQGDVSIRGGIFENTGFRVGAATIIDPQTGHYFAELPIAPEMLNGPTVLTGADNALSGFNSTVGTLSYGWSQIVNQGSLTVGGGDNDLNFQRIHQGLTGRFNEESDWTWGVEAEYSRSESDGTINHGDHDFNRTTGRFQVVGLNSQTDFFAGYQEKFFGWPNMYTPAPSSEFPSRPEYLETENLKTRLFIINHLQNYGDESHFQASAYYRRNTDDYTLDRRIPEFYSAHHETDVSSFAFEGAHRLNEAFAINYFTQFTADDIDSYAIFNGSEIGGLEQGDFTSRNYYKVTILPEYLIQLDENKELKLRAGLTYDDTNRSNTDSEVSPVADVTWTRRHNNGGSENIYLAYSQTSQVAGYTAIGGSLGGLFASNRDLDREISQNLELGTKWIRNNWSVESAIFYRWDDDLVDWTYSSDNPFSRKANSVDIETFGIELIGTRRWGTIEGVASYTFLHKDEDYGNLDVDASFYALNYPEHRATLGLIWSPIQMVQVRIDNEWRSQEDNVLRSSDDEAFFTHAAISIYPPKIDGLELFLAVDNAWDDDFQDVPGTPGRGDQYSGGVTYRW